MMLTAIEEAVVCRPAAKTSGNLRLDTITQCSNHIKIIVIDAFCYFKENDYLCLGNVGMQTHHTPWKRGNLGYI